MQPEDDDFRLGVPGAGRAALAPTAQPVAEPRAAQEREQLGGLTPSARQEARQDELELRPGETELGRPPQVPADLTELSRADLAQLKLLDDEQAARDVAEAELLLTSDPTGLGWLGWFGSPLAFAALVGLTGVLGVFLFNQTAQLLHALAAQPEWAQYVGYTGLGVFGLCVLYAFVRFCVLYARLRENRQLRVKGIKELSNRTRLRWLAAAKTNEARAQIETYLRTYPIETDKERRALENLGVTPEAVARLKAVRTELLDHDKFASSDQWFARFRDGFQSVIDEAAEKRTKYWASRIWVVTAVAPNAVIDSGATLFYTFSMLSDLCQLYNLRAGRTGTAVLMGRTFFNAYLAGQATEWEKLAEDQYDQLFNEAMNTVGVSVSAGVVGKVVGKVGAKVTTGYLNRVLLIRLGRYACRLLRPVSRD